MDIANIFCQGLGVTSHAKTFLTVCRFRTDLVSIWTARGIRLKKILIRSNGLGYLFWKNCHPFKRLGLSGPIPLKKIVLIRSKGLGYPFEKSVIRSKRICRPFERLKLSVQRWILAEFPSQNHFVASHSRRTICFSRSRTVTKFLSLALL